MCTTIPPHIPESNIHLDEKRQCQEKELQDPKSRQVDKCPSQKHSNNRRRRRLDGGIERGMSTVILLHDGGGVIFLAVGPEGGDFEEHSEEGEDAGNSVSVDVSGELLAASGNWCAAVLARSEGLCDSDNDDAMEIRTRRGK